MKSQVSSALYLSPKEAAAILRVSERSIRRWVTGGTLPAKRVGRQIRIPRDAVEDVSAWPALARDSFGREWDNPKDAVYDDWKRLYGV